MPVRLYRRGYSSECLWQLLLCAAPRKSVAAACRCDVSYSHLFCRTSIDISKRFLDQSIDPHWMSKHTVALHVHCALGVDIDDILYNSIFSILGHMLVAATFITMLRAERARR